jgi:acetyl esterase/lipase
MADARLIGEMLMSRGRTFSYGPHRSQRADLHVRGAGSHPRPVMVLIHGGAWQARYGRFVTRALAGDLARRGWAAWNVEYRRVGAGGGWPATFEDVARAIDHLPGLADPRLDLQRVSVLGHSAGGHLALWAASRGRLATGAPGALHGRPAVPLCQVVSLAGVADLTAAYARWHGGAARALMGGSPQELPERFAAGDPALLVPADTPALLVHGVEDETVSIELSRSYAAAARAAGGEVELVEIDGEDGVHRAHVNPRGRSWAQVIARLDGLSADRSPGAVRCS